MSHETTPRCDADIIEIYLYGAEHFGVDQAERYHSGLISTFDLLAANPRLARLRPEYRPPVRLHPYRSHMVVYIEATSGIRILRVLHGRQDWQRHLD